MVIQKNSKSKESWTRLLPSSSTSTAFVTGDVAHIIEAELSQLSALKL
jgi:hypothetical protein